MNRPSGFGPPIGFVVAHVLSMALLAQALKTLPVGKAYAIWTGIGAAGTAVVGPLWLDESREALKLVSLVLLLAGTIGLSPSSPRCFPRPGPYR